MATNDAKLLLPKRRMRDRFQVGTDASLAPGGLDPATGVAGIDSREAMSRLDPDGRALLALRYVAGFDSNEPATPDTHLVLPRSLPR